MQADKKETQADERSSGSQPMRTSSRPNNRPNNRGPANDNRSAQPRRDNRDGGSGGQGNSERRGQSANSSRPAGAGNAPPRDSQRDGSQRDSGQRDSGQRPPRTGSPNAAQQPRSGPPRSDSARPAGGRSDGPRTDNTRPGAPRSDSRPPRSGERAQMTREGRPGDRPADRNAPRPARGPGGDTGRFPPARHAPANGRPAGRDNRGGRGNDRGRREMPRELEERKALEAKVTLELKAAKEVKTPPTSVVVGDFITVRDLAALMDRSPIDLIKILIQYGIMAPITHNIDHDTAVILGEELGVSVKRPKVEEVEAPIEEVAAEPKTTQSRIKEILSQEENKNLAPRPPVVAVLGHVDHGKTTLLDRIRHTDVASGEAGGITQRTGAYQVTIHSQKITFLDTPGHEAFTAMRARGARVTDIVVLVVAADDGVMPQTKEAISHARAAGVQIMVALNKIDKPNANPDRVLEELAKEGLQAEQWGGDTIVTPVSALRNQGIDQLLENILVVAELQEYKANPKGKLVGTVIEATLDKQRGVTATLLVQNGTLRPGDSIIAGATWGRVKALFDYEGKAIKSAGPSTPVIVLGMQDAPMAGELFEGVASDRLAREIAEQRQLEAQSVLLAGAKQRMSLEDLFARFEGGETKTLNLIVRADLQGTLEPVVKSLQEIHNDEISIKILQTSVGNISESDVMLAEASEAVIIGFSVGVDKAAAARAEQSGVEIRNYDVIYKMIEDIEDALKGMLTPIYELVPVGHANILQLFKLRRGFIAGCMVLDGIVKRGSLARVQRNGSEVISDVRVETLRRFTEDVNEVRSGFECGIKLSDKDENLQLGDVIELYEKQRKR